jgi:hypothetical protein
MWITLLLSLLINAQENKQVRVAVIDGGFASNIGSLVKLCGPVKVIKTKDRKDFIEHGTTVVGLIDYYKGNKVNVCYILIAHMGTQSFTDSINYANNQNADIINISAMGLYPINSEYEAIKNFLFKDKKRLIFTAAGNTRYNLNKDCISFPSCYRLLRIKSVTNNKEYSNTLDKSIISDKDGREFKVFGTYEIGGTSGSTAIETGKYLNETN